MLKFLPKCQKLISCNTFNGSLLSSITVPVLVTSSRNTVVLKRKFPVRLYKEGNKPRIGNASYFYEVEELADCKPEPVVDVVLTSYVSGVGNPGDIISLKRSRAYYNLILPGLADFASPERLEYSKNLKTDEDVQEKQISPSAELCIHYLQSRKFSIVMNKETKWTIEPWHVRASFRKAGVQILSDSCIELPPRPIIGPDMDLEGKEFYVIVTINKKHKVKACCRIHHWSTSIADRLPYVQDHWLQPAEIIFPEGKDNSSEQTKSQ